MRSAIVVAGGTGERLGVPGGKQLAVVAGRPLLAHTLLAFVECADIDEVVLVAHPDRVEEYRAEAVEPLRSRKVAAVVAGGETRFASVAAGLASVSAAAEIIAVHDGARPLVTPGLISRAVRALEADADLDGVVVGHPSYDTLKVVDAGAAVLGTADRSSLWAAQTPQVFRAGSLRRAYAGSSDASATDDAGLIERAGGRLRMVLGPRDNIKVTVPDDLWVVEQLLAARQGGRVDG